MAFVLEMQDGSELEFSAAGWLSERTWVIPGWFTAYEAHAIVRGAVELGPTGIFVGLGVWRGRSTAILADALGPGWRIIGVDSWPDTYAGADAGDADPAAAKTAALAELGRRTNISVVVADTRDAANLPFSDTDILSSPLGYVARPPITHRALGAPQRLDAVADPVRVLFVDAEHSEDAVMGDALAWERRIAPGGLIYFHDVSDRRWGDAVRRGIQRWQGASSFHWKARGDLGAGGSLFCAEKVG